MDATVNVDKLYSLALEQPAFHVRVMQPITAANMQQTTPYFLALLEADFSTDDTLSVTTHANTFIRIHTARNNFPAELGGTKGFDEWVRGSMTINPSEAYVTHKTVKKVNS